MSAPKYGFGTGSRDNSQEKKKGIPGPGQYSIQNCIGTEGKKQTFGRKFTEDRLIKDSRNMPGPG